MKTRYFSILIPLILAICALGAVAGCGSDQVVTAGVEPEVVNNVDSFEFQVTSVQNFSGVWSYNWLTTGTIADVNQSSTVSAGQISVRIADADGNTVYIGDLAQTGTFVTSAGTAGVWRIDVVLSEGSGTLNFRTEKNQ